MKYSFGVLRYLIILIFILTFVDSQSGIDYCYESDYERPQIEFFSSKTSYLVANRPETDNHFFVEGKSVYLFYD